MKIFTLFTGWVAILHFEKVDARNHDDSNSRENLRTAIPRGAGVPPTARVIPEALQLWVAHEHPHLPATTFIHPEFEERRIGLYRVRNHQAIPFYSLKGDLVPDPSIANCGGPYGYVNVTLPGSPNLYACIYPTILHRAGIELQHLNEDPVFVATIFTFQWPKKEGVLSPHNRRSALNTHGIPDHLEYHTHLEVAGHVRYIKNVGEHRFDVDGNIYQFPLEE